MLHNMKGMKRGQFTGSEKETFAWLLFGERRGLRDKNCNSGLGLRVKLPVSSAVGVSQLVLSNGTWDLILAILERERGRENR